MTGDRSAMSLEVVNREVYLLLKEGIKARVSHRRARQASHPAYHSKFHLQASVFAVGPKIGH